MHNHSKHNCIILKDGVNDPGLAFAGKVGLGPFWTWVQDLSYVHARQLVVGTFVSSFRHERTSTGGRSTRRCKCKIYSTVYTLITHKPYWQSRGVFVGHIHLDKNTFNILFHKGTVCNSLLIILLMVTLYIYM
jgi:hypothetical protein